MPSIYDTSNWGTNIYYKKHSVVRNGGRFYYSLVDHTSDSAQFNADYTANRWGGVGSAENGETKPQFFWTPSYSSPVSITPRAKIIKFGDGYEQRVSDGINTTLLALDLVFEGRNLDETTAISHFVNQRGGVESFIMVPPAPFHKLKRFIDREFSCAPTFYDNYTLRLKIEEDAN